MEQTITITQLKEQLKIVKNIIISNLLEKQKFELQTAKDRALDYLITQSIDDREKYESEVKSRLIKIDTIKMIDAHIEHVFCDYINKIDNNK